MSETEEERAARLYRSMTEAERHQHLHDDGNNGHEQVIIT
jgi:hypothetical protein